MRAQRAVHTEHLETLLNAAMAAHNLAFAYDSPTSRQLRLALEPFGRSACPACSQIAIATEMVRALVTVEYTGRKSIDFVCQPCMALGKTGGAEPLLIEPATNARKVG